jgi:hypothetical protein
MADGKWQMAKLPFARQNLAGLRQALRLKDFGRARQKLLSASCGLVHAGGAETKG